MQNYVDKITFNMLQLLNNIYFNYIYIYEPILLSHRQDESSDSLCISPVLLWLIENAARHLQAKR